MVDIEVFQPQVEPTICGPVSDFKELTLSSNAITLGWMGFVSGVITSVLLYVAIVHVAPRMYWFGHDRGWWS